MLISLPSKPQAVPRFKMQASRDSKKKKKKLETKGSCSRALCCTSCSRLIGSSSSEGSESCNNSDRYTTTVSSLAHAMVQERLDQMIQERQDRRLEEIIARRRRPKDMIRKEGKTKFIVMVAMEMHSYDPRQDFKESLMEMISANHIYKARDLRRLLNYYLSMNSADYRDAILDVFYEVCTFLFLRCK